MPEIAGVQWWRHEGARLGLVLWGRDHLYREMEVVQGGRDQVRSRGLEIRLGLGKVLLHWEILLRWEILVLGRKVLCRRKIVLGKGKQPRLESGLESLLGDHLRPLFRHPGLVRRVHRARPAGRPVGGHARPADDDRLARRGRFLLALVGPLPDAPALAPRPATVVRPAPVPLGAAPGRGDGGRQGRTGSARCCPARRP